jgi:hypothetical protein
VVTHEVEENDHDSVWQKLTGGGDPAKSDRLSVGAAKNVVFVRGPSGVVREAVPLVSLIRPIGVKNHVDRLRANDSPAI